MRRELILRDWQPGKYERFSAERERPVRDLVAAVPLAAPERITDLGCGSGLSTAAIAERWPDATITGLDRSPAMLRRAAQRLPELHWREGDIATYVADEPQDLVLANASLHWLPDHEALLHRLCGQLATGGVLAVQMPNNTAEPSHELMRAVAAEDPFRQYLGGLETTRFPLHDPDSYYDWLCRDMAAVEIWETRYLHALAGASAIADWFATTALKPYLDALPDELRAAFRRRYEALLASAYPVRGDGRVLLAMPRLFIVARRAA